MDDGGGETGANDPPVQGGGAQGAWNGCQQRMDVESDYDPRCLRVKDIRVMSVPASVPMNQ
jgi:hypothetical protein